MSVIVRIIAVLITFVADHTNVPLAESYDFNDQSPYGLYATL